ncbi:MAG: RluA family pseudouridine synthase [Oscillospiraceae bacterium]|nr:RluA family pseudouridine synthase [Oscillospiraceae bacterium]
MTLSWTTSREGKLLSFLRRELRMSDGVIRRLKPQGSFFVDGLPAHTDKKLLPGQTITVVIRESRPTEFTPEYDPVEVLFEDEALLAVDKPAGVIAHPTFHRTDGTLLTRVLGYYETTGQDCGIHAVNRLDRDTRGIVLFAKNSHIHGLCYNMQLAGGFQKTYHALCLGAPPDDEGEVALPIGRVDGGSLLRRIDPEGQAALTRWRVLEKGGGMSRLELSPVTGRTHQLRLHCLSLGCPILGDPQYATEESREVSARLGLAGQELVAVRLAFSHPLDGMPMEICAKSDVFLPKNG